MSGHAHRHDDFTRAFAVGIALNVAIVAVELTFGVLGNSMALISDGGHNLSDVLGRLVR
jgi:cobalt-zinc-cadmium efflux system protein